VTPDERLAKIAEVLKPCGAPDIAGGYDLCPCGSGEAWPCQMTQAAWLAAGLDLNTEVRKVTKAAEIEMAIEQEHWEELNAIDPAAARRYAARQLGW
jgi:hypothetical protein